MDAILDWVKPIIYFSIFITILMQILPGDKYKKYIRFFAGLLMIVLVMNPILNLFRQDDISAQIFSEEFFQDQEDAVGIEIEELEESANEYYEKIIEESMSEEAEEGMMK